MTQAASKPMTLANFLQLPETKPANEFINGKILQKPMPKGKHSRLQLKLCNRINAVSEASKIAYAFPELRCSFGDRSTVPDIAVFYWERIAFDDEGEPQNDFRTYPDWTLEILLSPDQRHNRVVDNIVYCLKHGCQLGWLIDPTDRSVMVYRPNQLPLFCEGQDVLPVLEKLDLPITVNQMFALLKMLGSGDRQD